MKVIVIKIKPYQSKNTLISKNMTHGKFNCKIAIHFISSKNTDEEHVMHSKRDNIEIIIYDEADELIQELF